MSERVVLQAESPFSYRCTRCKSCCTSKRIQVNPYEIARLARTQGVSTAEFRDRFTTGGALNQDDEHHCVFLGEDGCGVHPDRPLVCRLFPLGRSITASGTVSYGEVDRSWANGAFGDDARVIDYVEAQGAPPFIVAADAYFAWFCRAREIALTAEDSADAAERDLLDIDGMVGAHCAATGRDEPHTVEARMRLHLSLLDDLLGEPHV